MLNELASIRRGLTSAGIKPESVHPDVQPVSKNKKPLLLRLKPNGELEEIELLSGSLWTFRDGKHNSFPFVSPPPLLDLPSHEREDFNKRWKDATLAERRQALCQAAATHPSGGQLWDGWPGKGLLESLRGRRAALDRIGAEAAAVPAVIDRFLAIFSADGNGPCRRRDFANALVAALLHEVETEIDDWMEVARPALVGEGVRKKKLVGADFYFDVAPGQFDHDVHDPGNGAAAARVLSESDETKAGRCAITGKDAQLQRDNFPQVNFPALGLSYVFSKNDDLPAVGSYHRFGHESFPVGRLTVGDLAGAIKELVGESRKNVTWRTVPGEKPKTTDLLIAFVEGAPDAPAAGLFAGDGDPDEAGGELDPVAIYERRTERLIEAVKGTAQEDFRKTPVQVCLLRKVDEGNRKALLHRHLTVGQLYDRAQEWAQAQRNLPCWIFRSPRKGRRPPQSLTPLSIPSLTRKQFVRGGTEATDAIGLPATEAFGFFLQEGDARRLAQRFIHVVLKRHQHLLEATAHVKHGARACKLETGTALRVPALLAILLHTLGRRGGSWMNEAAFRLGQLLSIADVVHAGYCADVRKGKVPPALLGNSVLTMAQANPAKALAALARRWKPYASWAKRASVADAAKLRSSERPEESDRGWKISQAIWQHRRAAEISAALHDRLPQTTDDVFRAELLLGYVSGLPPMTKAESGDDDERRQGSDSDA